MHQHLNVKSLTFYSVAISLVLLLFNIITAYGESNLKAPSAINDRYRLILKENLPICPKSDALILSVQQSGIYLNGNLLPEDNNTKNEKRNTTHFSLNGNLNHQILTLSGKVNRSNLCNISEVSEQAKTSVKNNFDLVTIQVQMASKENLTGEINVNGSPKLISLRAVPKKEKDDEKNQH